MLEKFIIGRILQELPFSPNEGQRAVIEKLSKFLTTQDPYKLFLLKGYAGTGKTSLVSALVRMMEQLHQPCVLLAPTGRAAKVIAHYSGFPAYTIHKYIYRQERLGTDSFGLRENKNIHTLFIVDEASMISTERDNSVFGTGMLLDDLISFVYSGQGCSILMLGDDAQLPPVGQSTSCSLSADYLAGYELNIHEATLTEVARQALNSGILKNATNLRLQINNRSTFDINIAEDVDIKICKGIDVQELLEQSYQEVGIEQTIVLTRSNRRTNLYNQGVRARILWRDELISNGDRLMISKNNYFWTEQYEGLPFLANGDMLEVTRVKNEREIYGFHFVDISLHSLDYDWDIDAILWLDTLTTDSPEANYQLHKELFARIAEDYPEIHNRKELFQQIMSSPYYNALQARFAYAVTCHKAQGGQWKHVYIDPGPVADEDRNTEYLRWYYTALTRATERVFILNT